MTVRAILAVLLATVLSCLAVARPLSAQPAGRQVDENILLEQISVAMQTNPSLRGAWLWVRSDSPSGGFTFWRVLDRSRAGQQKQEIDRFLRGWLSEGSYRFESGRDQEFPFSELIGTLRQRIDEQPGLAGCSIVDWHLAPVKAEEGKLDLMIRGRVADKDQIREIERICNLLMRSNPVWVAPGRFVEPSPGGENEALQLVPLLISPNVSGLEVIRSNEDKASEFYATGLSEFRQRDYSSAAAAFRSATLESPRTLLYHYWRVMTDIALGRQEEATLRMENIIRTFGVDKSSRDYRLVVRSLEKVQGPLRRQLNDIEDRAMQLTSASQRKPGR